MAKRGRITLDLSKFFDREARRSVIPAYKRLMQRKQGHALDPAPPNAPSTIRRKGKNHWLVDTGETKTQGFRHAVRPNALLVYASGARHSGRYTQMIVAEGNRGRRRGVSRIPTVATIRKRRGPQPTYRQLFRYHNKGGPGKPYSGIFPKLPAGSKFFDRMRAECIRQLKPQIIGAVKGEVKQWNKALNIKL